MKTKLSIVIPVFNEAKTVCEILSRVWNQELPGLAKELIIVESNSNDGTRDIVRAFVASESAKAQNGDSLQMIEQAAPRGKGNAVREGLLKATGDIVLIQDGDLEYDVSDYKVLLQPIIDGRTDFVLGSRHLSSGNWRIRKFERNPLKAFLLNLGGVFFHSLFNFLYGQRLTDPTTMFKVFRRKCLENITLKSNRFDFDFELLGKLIRAGYAPLEMPVSYASRGFDEGKKVRWLYDPLTWLWAIVRFRFVALTSK